MTLASAPLGADRRHSARILGFGALAVMVVLLASACRVEVRTTVQVDFDGKGTVTQAIGFDDAALARVGDPDQALAADDLRAAGWIIDPAVREGDLTWIRAHQPFDSVEQGNALLAQLSGPDGPYRDLRIATDGGIVYRTVEVSGQIDTSAGLAMFGDAELTAALGGDPSGGLIAAIEAEEGQPAESMTGFLLEVDLPDRTRTYSAALGEPAIQQFTTGSSESVLGDLIENLLLVMLVVLTGAVITVRVRASRRRSARMMRSSTRRR